MFTVEDRHPENPRYDELALCLAAMDDLTRLGPEAPTPASVYYAREFLSRMVFYGARLPDAITATGTGGVFMARDGHGIEIRADGTMAI